MEHIRQSSALIYWKNEIFFLLWNGTSFKTANA